MAEGENIDSIEKSNDNSSEDSTENSTEDMKELTSKDIVVKVSDDKMKAFINVCPLTAEYEGSVATLRDALTDRKVVYGIKEEELQRIVEEKLYYKDILIAEGVPCVNGTDGYFEFLFNTVADKKPKIQEDGSVDYSSLGDIEVVEAGDEIVKYHPALKGQNGVTVTGSTLNCKNGKELVPLKGKGFTVSEDKLIYTALITGKVEYSAGKINVTNLLIIEDDVTHATGNVEFSGDIHVKGTIYTGMTVKATGNITVDGHVEAATLVAGKDIVLKGGMQGAGKGKVSAGGNVSAKFFEQTTIQCKENLNANALLSCDVTVDGEVIISGKLGVIIGGRVFARKSIRATIIGNMSEVKTRLIVGSDKDLVPEIMKADSEIERLEKEIKKINYGVIQINQLLAKKENPKLTEKKLQLIRAKIAKESELSSMKVKKEEFLVNLDKAVHSKLIVQKNIYPGINLTINGCTTNILEENYSVTYHVSGMEIVVIPNVS